MRHYSRKYTERVCAFDRNQGQGRSKRALNLSLSFQYLILERKRFSNSDIGEFAVSDKSECDLH